jgi:hypothetical protein
MRIPGAASYQAGKILKKCDEELWHGFDSLHPHKNKSFLPYLIRRILQSIVIEDIL